MYPHFAAVAYRQHATNAGDTLTAIAADEGTHRDLYQQALADIQSGHDTTVAAPELDPVTVTAHAPHVHGLARHDIEKAMHGEAFAWVKYAMFADQARAEGYPNLAALFDGVSTIEFREHFSEEANLVELVGSTDENLRDCIRGERFESSSMYPRCSREAERSGDTEAADRFAEIAMDETGHLHAFQRALKG